MYIYTQADICSTENLYIIMDLAQANRGDMYLVPTQIDV